MNAQQFDQQTAVLEYQCARGHISTSEYFERKSALEQGFRGHLLRRHERTDPRSEFHTKWMPLIRNGGVVAAKRHELFGTTLRYKCMELKQAQNYTQDDFDLYGAVFSNIDRQLEILEPYCVRNTDEFLEDGWVAWSHQNDKLPVGYPVKASQDEFGFRVLGRWHDTKEAQELKAITRERLAEGKRVFCSIGFISNPETERFETINGQRIKRIGSISVYEVSLCLLAANPAAHVIAA